MTFHVNHPLRFEPFVKLPGHPAIGGTLRSTKSLLRGEGQSINLQAGFSLSSSQQMEFIVL